MEGGVRWYHEAYLSFPFSAFGWTCKKGLEKLLNVPVHLGYLDLLHAWKKSSQKIGYNMCWPVVYMPSGLTECM